MLLTLAKLKADFDIPNSADDARLTDLITQISNRCANYCNRVLERAVSRTEYHDAKRSFVLALAPVESLALYYDTARIFGSDTLLTANSEYVLTEESGLVRLFFDVAHWPGAIKAVVTGGYVAAGGTPGAGQAAIPDDLARAVMRQCVFEWKNRSEFGRQSIGMQGTSVSLAEFELLPEVKRTLDSYRRITF